MDKELLTIIKKAKQKYSTQGFLILGVFGSRARGDFKTESDLDIDYIDTLKTVGKKYILPETVYVT